MSPVSSMRKLTYLPAARTGSTHHILRIAVDVSIVHRLILVIIYQYARICPFQGNTPRSGQISLDPNCDKLGLRYALKMYGCDIKILSGGFCLKIVSERSSGHQDHLGYYANLVVVLFCLLGSFPGNMVPPSWVWTSSSLVYPENNAQVITVGVCLLTLLWYTSWGERAPAKTGWQAMQNGGRRAASGIRRYLREHTRLVEEAKRISHMWSSSSGKGRLHQGQSSEEVI